MGCSNDNNDDWSDWRNYVLKELERLNNNIEALREKQQDSRIDIKELQTKIYMISMLTSFLVSIIVPIILHFI